MADQQSRGGKKRGKSQPHATDQGQPVEEGRDRPRGNRPGDAKPNTGRTRREKSK